jgi:hypothetical protein
VVICKVSNFFILNNLRLFKFQMRALTFPKKKKLVSVADAGEHVAKLRVIYVD